ncbi:glutathione S-transferase [Azospirillum baldaniorum]|uniref:glutathione S-transferase family protein n=1 Tax=Azospirillum baldaniorum TaxID=1064539 RepID=UPI00119CA0A7|nr:glutathione S-transferase family protein [Azospirillum baldaniorum]TWA57350.1 glutathione S-transferase [Azospirillum baldaniorum]
MTQGLTVWGRRSAFNVQKVLWLVGELGLEHEVIEVGGPFGGLDRPDFLALNPHGRVPVIRDGGTVVWESHSVLRYLGARYGEGTLWPSDPAERSLGDRWLDWAQTALQPAFITLFRGLYVTPEDQRDEKALRDAKEKTDQHYALLDRELAGRPYLAGDRFSIADIPAGATLYRYYALDLDRPALLNLEGWYGRLAERASHGLHVRRPLEELKF